MAKSHLEMSHALGLVDYVPKLDDKSKVIENTGWSNKLAVESINRRYDDFNKKEGTKEFEAISESSIDRYIREIGEMKHGGYKGLAASWANHAYSIHVIMEDNKTIFIYVNRGRTHIDNTDGSIPTVYAFSVPNENNKQTVKEFAQRLLNAAASRDDENREKMKKFLSNHRNNCFYDEKLSGTLAKKRQTTGNCTIANSKVAWHFMLASQFMKSTNCSFKKAYNDTEQDYHDMRLKDRVAAAHFLLKAKGKLIPIWQPNEPSYQQSTYTAENYRYNYFQTIVKLAKKDNRDYIRQLIKECNSAELEALVSPLMDEKFNQHAQIYAEDRRREDPAKNRTQLIIGLYESRNKIIDHIKPHLAKLPEELQEKFLSQDITLLEYASGAIQGKYLDKDSDKYDLYTTNRNTGKLNPNAIKSELKKLVAVSKTSENPATANKKQEKKINDKIADLYSYLYANQNKIDIGFKELCLACCHDPKTGKYTTTTDAAKWLIKELQSDTGSAMGQVRFHLVGNSNKKSKDLVKEMIAPNKIQQPIDTQKIGEKKPKTVSFAATIKPEMKEKEAKNQPIQQKKPKPFPDDDPKEVEARKRMVGKLVGDDEEEEIIKTKPPLFDDNFFRDEYSSSEENESKKINTDLPSLSPKKRKEDINAKYHDLFSYVLSDEKKIPIGFKELCLACCKNPLGEGYAVDTEDAIELIEFLSPNESPDEELKELGLVTEELRNHLHINSREDVKNKMQGIILNHLNLKEEVRESKKTSAETLFGDKYFRDDYSSDEEEESEKINTSNKQKNTPLFAEDNLRSHQNALKEKLQDMKRKPDAQATELFSSSKKP